MSGDAVAQSSNSPMQSEVPAPVGTQTGLTSPTETQPVTTTPIDTQPVTPTFGGTPELTTPALTQPGLTTPIDPLPVTATTATDNTPAIQDPFAPYTDATINSLQTTDPTLARALQLAAPSTQENEFTFGDRFAPPSMTQSGFSHFEQNVAANYASYTPNGSLSENANTEAILNNSLSGLSANDAAAATIAINSAVNDPYQDSTINSFFLSDRPIASALQSAEPGMTSAGFTQFETNLETNYANALDGTQPATNAEVMQNSTAGLSASDSAAATATTNTALNVPYFDEDLNDFNDDPTLVQTLSDAEPNMSVQGFSQFEYQLYEANMNTLSGGGALNDAAVVSNATAGLSATDAATAENAYSKALNYNGQVADSNSVADANFASTMIGTFDPTLANTINDAQASMTQEGFVQFATDTEALFNHGDAFSPNNNAIIAAAVQNLSAPNQAAVDTAYATASDQT